MKNCWQSFSRKNSNERQSEIKVDTDDDQQELPSSGHKTNN